MTITGNNLDNNALAALTKQAAPQVTSAIKQASTRTGVDFAYLMEQAAAESSFNTKAEAKTSSATGLYQFIEKTWLHMVRQHGHKYGMGDMAAKIDTNGNVADPSAKQDILELRKDPEKAALLAAEFAAGNKRHLEQYVEGEIGPTELYFAHFMGASGATGFLNAMKENPMTIGADIFPREARANHNVFYDRKTGEPRTLLQIYDFFDKKFSGGAIAGKPETQIQDKIATAALPQEKNTPRSAVSSQSHMVAAFSAPFQTFQSFGFERTAPMQDKTILSFLQSGFFGKGHSNDFFLNSSDFLLQHYDALLFAQQK